MAEDQEPKGAELSSDEKAEVDELIKTSVGGTVAEAAAPGLKEKIQRIFSNKKLLMIFVGGALLLFIAIGAGVYSMMLSAELEEVVPVVEEKAEEEIKEEETIVVEKVNIYKLEPFFLPLRDKGKETGRFISLSANLILSNIILLF